jgi:hypothetical protein
MSALPPTSSHPASRAVFVEPPPAPTSSRDVGAPRASGPIKESAYPLPLSLLLFVPISPHTRVRRARKTTAGVAIRRSRGPPLQSCLRLI